MLKKDQVLYWMPVLFDAYIGHKGIYVIGYTKSGTNWLKNMLRYYYDFKLPARYIPGKPFFGPRVYHMHRFLPTSYFQKKSIYLVRDGRDTIVSRYFTMVNQASQSLMKKDFINYSGETPTKENIKLLLPLYIKFLINYHKSTIDYISHVNKAIENNFLILKYEGLHKETAQTLKKSVQYLTPEIEISDSRIDESVEYWSLEASKKRQKKDTGFFRKGGGQTGDWKNYFTLESANVYNEYAGDILIELGYEKSKDWVNEFSVSDNNRNEY